MHATCCDRLFTVLERWEIRLELLEHSVFTCCKSEERLANEPFKDEIDSMMASSFS